VIPAPDGEAELTIHPLADTGLLFQLGAQTSTALTRRIAALTAALDAAALPGLIDLVPSYTTLMLTLDPALADPAAIAMTVRHFWLKAAATQPAPGRQVTIPVIYGGERGPDLGDVAAHTGLSSEEVIARHAGAPYTVVCLGFAPGFAFLTGLPPELETPRLAKPRTHVPAGSVGIGGVQTGIYPLTTPGGWRLIGYTPSILFDPDRAEPFLLQPGDEVRFEPSGAPAE
jgi:KipI family sensor histidine kinase inhibitor